MTDDTGEAGVTRAKREVPLWRHILVRLVQAGLGCTVLPLASVYLNICALAGSASVMSRQVSNRRMGLSPGAMMRMARRARSGDVR